MYIYGLSSAEKSHLTSQKLSPTQSQAVPKLFALVACDQKKSPNVLKVAQKWFH